MDNLEFLDLQNLPQKSNDLASLFRTYSICTSFDEIIKSLKKVPPTFTIITKNNKFKCHLEIIAAVSKTVFQLIQKDSKVQEFSVSPDFDDSKFDQFVSFLNGDRIKISDENRSYFKLISEIFQIDTVFFNPDKQNELSLSRFSRYFHSVLPKIPKTVTISNSKGSYPVNYLISLSYSPILNKIALSDSNQIKVELQTEGDISEFVEYLNDNTMTINAENYTIIKNCMEELEITLDNDIMNEIMKKFKFYVPILSNANLYDTVFDINSTNVDEIYQVISNSHYYLNPDLHFELFSALENAYKYRPAHFESVISLISKLQNESFKNSLSRYLKTKRLAQEISIPFLRSLYDEKIIDRDEIIQIIKMDTEIKAETDYSFTSKTYIINADIMVFFAKEKYEIDPEDFMKTLQSNYMFRIDNKQNELNQYVDHWDQYEKDINAHYDPNCLYGAIFRDDAEALQRITSQQQDFDYDQQIKRILFEKSKYLNNASLASIAAFFGSLKCFRFLVLQQADVSQCAKYAIMGGNSEIIRLVKQNGGNFEDKYYVAVEFHRHDIFKWLLLNEGPIKDLYSKINYRSESKPAIETAIASHNNRALIYLFDNGIDNEKKDQGISLIGLSVLTLNCDAIKLMLSTFLVNPNKINLRLKCPPIFLAASFDSLEAMKLLIEYGKCIIPKKNEFDVLMIAAKKGFTDIADYLVPFYKDDIDEKYINNATNEQIKKILLQYKK